MMTLPIQRKLRFALIVSMLIVLTACGGDGGGIPATTVPFTPITGATGSVTATRLPATSTPRPLTATSRPSTATNTLRPPTATRPTNTPPITPTVPPIQVTSSAGGVTTFALRQGFGAQKGFWQVYFTAPTGSRDAGSYFGGIDEVFAASIAAARSTLDIAGYEFNLPTVTRAVLDAHTRGVRVRVVTDNEDGLEDDDTTLGQLEAAGIAIVADTRSALMHNKFMIVDSTLVWTGSWNYTVNDTYRNNNNALVLRSSRAVQNYQAEFDEMFVRGAFGPTSPVNSTTNGFNQDGTPIEIYFASEDDVIGAILREINAARTSIRFMAFSYTVDDMGEAMQNRFEANVSVRGIFERVGSQTQFSEFSRLYCAGVDARQDGNPFVLHHKVIIVDDLTVLTGSFNFSQNAINSNDENLIIIRDRDLAAQYTTEFDRRWRETITPSDVDCS